MRIDARETWLMPQVLFKYPADESRAIDVPVGDSIMRGAVMEGVPGIEAECGGALTCATCHVHVADDWFDRLIPPDLAETELLEMVEEYQPNSRLSCQIMVSDDLDGIVVIIPQSNL